jgi:hypothetical protein
MAENVTRQNADGSWSEAEPIPWAPGEDAEAHYSTSLRRYVAKVYLRSTLLYTHQTRTRLGLWLSVTLRHGKVRWFGVFG